MSRPGVADFRCPYCGGRSRRPDACAAHREIAADDPARGLTRGELTERDLGLELPWPEGETSDEGRDR